MFLGHYALALGAKRETSRTSLGVLFAAAQLPDLLWPIFLLLGWERIAPGDRGFTSISFTYYPWSHSLLLVIGWGILASIFYFAITRDRRGATFVALLAVSHWVLDYITHRPDLPLYPGGPLVGLGLWNSATATVVIEGLMWVAGIAIYVKKTKPADAVGRYGFWILMLLLTLIYVSSINSPPPADLHAMGWLALATWVIPVWAGWVDAHREFESPADNPPVRVVSAG